MGHMTMGGAPDIPCPPAPGLLRTEGQRRFAAALVAMLFNAVVYLSANHHPREAPRLLALTALDRAIPFLPQTVWLYASDYFLLLGTFLVIAREQKALRFLLALEAIGDVSPEIRELLKASTQPVSTWACAARRQIHGT